jgi:serine/threonine protein kinase
VHAAHRLSIVHRDLKPSNVLVTTDGIPKLVDFGIAKVLDERHVDQTMVVTHVNMRVMTPEYASPEQLRGDAITPASDIYSLGVLLYELLSGSNLHRAPNVPVGMPAATRDATVSGEVIALNQRVDDALAGATPPWLSEICGQRSTDPRALGRELRALHPLVQQALQRDLRHRYQNAAAFADSIDHYLNGVATAPDSGTTPSAISPGSYKGRRIVVAIVVLIVLALAAVLIVR